ncbi:MAG: hypothetical protein L3J26_02480 [Candidatus Polarisedimenticolaceae bacterium]|nr:hypothetical protein [Candidatus Polarisedimenticolaceae bacterium]
MKDSRRLDLFTAVCLSGWQSGVEHNQQGQYQKEDATQRPKESAFNKTCWLHFLSRSRLAEEKQLRQLPVTAESAILALYHTADYRVSMKYV